MSDCVLRHGSWPTHHKGLTGRKLRTHPPAEVVPRTGNDLLIRGPREPGSLIPNNKAPQCYLPGGNARRELRANPGTGRNCSALLPGDKKSEAVKRMIE